MSSRKINFRKINLWIHNFFGHYFFGLIIIYSISGLAVNHIDDWNSSYMIETNKINISPLKDLDEISQSEVENIFKNLKLNAKYHDENIFYPDMDRIQLIINENQKIVINTSENTALYEKVSKRPILHAFNFLHLNEPKKFWTFYADFFAISLILISVSGIFIRKGKKGILGKNGIVTIAGLALPVIFLWLYY